MIHRLQKLKNKLRELGFDAFLVSNFYNIYYLSNFKTLTTNEREAWMLITKNNIYLFTDGRYLLQVKSQKSSFDKLRMTLSEAEVLKVKSYNLKLITPQKNLLQHLKEIIQQEKIEKLGFEADDLKFSEYQRIKEKFTKTVVNRHACSLQLIPTEKLIIKLREIKDGEEIKKIKKACQIANQCLEEIVKTIEVGQTEKEIAFKIEFWLKKRGFDLAFYPLVAIDESSSLPHYDTRTHGEQKVKKNSIILIDFGAKFQDYLSDITRMIFMGKPTNEMLKIYHLLLTVQQETIKQCNNETVGKNLDSFCRQQLTNHHSPITNHNLYPHSTGHGLGLEIHEYPKISEKSTDVIQKNQVFTIEPGIYLPGKFGVRIEDTVWMKKDNQTEVLTLFPKRTIILN